MLIVNRSNLFYKADSIIIQSLSLSMEFVEFIIIIIINTNRLKHNAYKENRLDEDGYIEDYDIEESSQHNKRIRNKSRNKN